jgi:RNA polymerase sigma factor (TIGR02999 family)
MSNPSEQNPPQDPKPPETPAQPQQPVDLRQLSETMYVDLRKIGGGMMKDERTGHTLTPTALVNEAIGDMLEHGQEKFNDRAHLMAAAALNMRRRLVDHARARGRVKRGGDRGKVTWEDVENSVKLNDNPDLVLSLDEAIEKIASEDPRHGRLVQLRVFSEMSMQDIARVLGISLSSVEKDWHYVRGRLAELLGIGEGPHKK